MLEDYFSKRPSKWILVGVAAVAVALLIFAAGISVGERVERPRLEPPFNAFGVSMPHNYMDSSHGAVGTVESSSISSLTLMTRGNVEETVIIGPSTVLEPSGAATTTLLSPGSHVVVIGQPQGTSSIEATLIRVLPQ